MIYITSFENETPVVNSNYPTQIPFIARFVLVPKFNPNNIVDCIINNVDSLKGTIQFFNISRQIENGDTKKDAIVNIASHWYHTHRMVQPLSIFLSSNDIHSFDDILQTTKIKDIISISGDIPYYPTTNNIRIKKRSKKSII